MAVKTLTFFARDTAEIMAGAGVKAYLLPRPTRLSHFSPCYP